MPRADRELLLPEWKHYRVIHSRFPPQNLFDEDPAENQLVAELEGATSDRLSPSKINLVDPTDVRFGDGWGAVMASFCYIRPGRFNTSLFGAYYCADSAHTAIAEWSHHAGMVWREHRFTDEASATVRAYVGQFAHDLVDVRANSGVHTKTSYERSQKLGVRLRDEKHFGILYRSVRHRDGFSAALLRPQATKPVKQSAHYNVLWNGQNFTDFAQLGAFTKIGS